MIGALVLIVFKKKRLSVEAKSKQFEAAIWRAHDPGSLPSCLLSACQTRACQMRACQMRSCQMRACQMRACQMRACQMRACLFSVTLLFSVLVLIKFKCRYKNQDGLT